jgi:hypothetical protein
MISGSAAANVDTVNTRSTHAQASFSSNNEAREEITKLFFGGGNRKACLKRKLEKLRSPQIILTRFF